MSAGGLALSAFPQNYPPATSGALSLVSAAFTAQGARPYNEDRLGRMDGGLWALADGLGGHKGGARAAEIAVQAGLASASHSAAPRLEERLKQAVSDAHAAVRAGHRSQPELAGMRSTLVMLGVQQGELAWAHTGDSRLYHLRGGKLQWRTRDHSAVQLLVAAGEVAEADIPVHPDRSRLVSCLGGEKSLIISARSAVPRAGDVLLLASDGLWEHFTDAELESVVGASASPEALLAALAAKVEATPHVNQDNYSGIAVFIGAV